MSQRTHSQVRVPRPHDHILLSQIQDSPNLENQVSVFMSPRKVARLYPRHWVPSSSPPTSHRATVEVFDPASTRRLTHIADLSSSLYCLGADPIENAASSSSYGQLPSDSLYIVDVFFHFLGNLFTELYSETAFCLFAYCIAMAVVSFVWRPLPRNGSIRQNIHV
jgi:hypothetical protein